MMENIEFANAYSEVLEILKYIPKEDYDKIPKDKIKLFNTNANKNYKFQYNPLITLDNQNVSKRTKAIIAILFRDYWATEKQREMIIRKQKYDIEKLEEEKKERYNTKDLFKNNISIKEDIQKDLEIQEKQISVHKKTFLARIARIIEKIFFRK